MWLKNEEKLNVIKEIYGILECIDMFFFNLLGFLISVCWLIREIYVYSFFVYL